MLLSYPSVLKVYDRSSFSYTRQDFHFFLSGLVDSSPAWWVSLICPTGGAISVGTLREERRGAVRCGRGVVARSCGDAFSSVT